MLIRKKIQDTKTCNIQEIDNLHKFRLKIEILSTYATNYTKTINKIVNK